MTDPAEELFGRLRSQDVNAWWHGMTGLVGETDQQI
jgi:hypothetical protein